LLDFSILGNWKILSTLCDSKINIRYIHFIFLNNYYIEIDIKEVKLNQKVNFMLATQRGAFRFLLSWLNKSRINLNLTSDEFIVR